MAEDSQYYPNSLEDFRRARRRAALQDIMAKFTGQSVDLLSFEEVRRKFRLEGGASLGVQDVPLDAIVGSVGRYHDFNRNFLPRHDNNSVRWANVKAATLEMSGLPPVELYKIGDVYFVVDGNHRVSVAKELDAPSIQAYVTEFRAKVPLAPTDTPDDIIIKAEYADFLEKTGLDHILPNVSFKMTTPGRYWVLEFQIDAYREILSRESASRLAYHQAVERWVSEIYLPAIAIIRDRGILRDFSNRTETDLYVWIFQHRSELVVKTGWDIDLLTAANDFVAARSEQPGTPLERVGGMLGAITPEALASGPTPGQWRREWLDFRPKDRLFANILVPLSGAGPSWSAVDLALAIARHEGGQLYGLHVAATAQQVESGHQIEADFLARCRDGGVPGHFAVEVGPIGRVIIDRARFADMVVLHLAHPPGAGPLQRLGSGVRMLLHRCPRPVLTVPGPAAAIERVLVAYDGSPKAQEALFVSAYLAAKANIELVVLTVTNPNNPNNTQPQAKTYLESQGVKPRLVTDTGDVATAILNIAAAYNCHGIIMGGYGFQPVLEVVLGSAVDRVLRETSLPVLICR